jgi:hypothetical protein
MHISSQFDYWPLTKAFGTSTYHKICHLFIPIEIQTAADTWACVHIDQTRGLLWIGTDKIKIATSDKLNNQRQADIYTGLDINYRSFLLVKKNVRGADVSKHTGCGTVERKLCSPKQPQRIPLATHQHVNNSFAAHMEVCSTCYDSCS